jgi:hypothetical protein
MCTLVSKGKELFTPGALEQFYSKTRAKLSSSFAECGNIKYFTGHIV